MLCSRDTRHPATHRRRSSSGSCARPTYQTVAPGMLLLASPETRSSSAVTAPAVAPTRCDTDCFVCAGQCSCVLLRFLVPKSSGLARPLKRTRTGGVRPPLGRTPGLRPCAAARFDRPLRDPLPDPPWESARTHETTMDAHERIVTQRIAPVQRCLEDVQAGRPMHRAVALQLAELLPELRGGRGSPHRHWHSAPRRA